MTSISGPDFSGMDWSVTISSTRRQMACFVSRMTGRWLVESWILWVGVGMTAYGFLYFFVHDGLVHNRWPWRVIPRGKYMVRLVQAHRMHHAVHGREGCVSFGFLYAPEVRKLKEELRAKHGGKYKGDEVGPGL